MPASRQAYWRAQYEPTFDRDWLPNVDEVADYTERPTEVDGYDLENDAGEPPDLWDDDDEDEQESQDLLDHLEEDLDGWTPNTRWAAQAEIEHDYEEEDWEARETERDLFADDDYDD